MKYYNKNTNEWYIEGSSITRKINESTMFSGYPTIEQLEEWGFEAYIDLDEDELVEAKANKLNELIEYDNSVEVNSFLLNNIPMWIDAKKRQQLRISLDALNNKGRTTATKWFNGIAFTFPINVWYSMLDDLETYASDALNVTEQHKANIKAINNIEELENYDFTTDYPDKVTFTI